MSSFEKIPNRFLTFGKNFQNLTNFLLESDIFHEIDQIFGPKAHSRAIRPPTQTKILPIKPYVWGSKSLKGRFS